MTRINDRIRICYSAKPVGKAGKPSHGRACFVGRMVHHVVRIMDDGSVRVSEWPFVVKSWVRAKS